MIAGKGMIANGFNHYSSNNRVLIFASGVSNSKENSYAGFEREKKTLTDNWQQNQDKLLVYFSTCSMYDPEQKDSPYVAHKLAMEQTIEGFGTPYLICRVSNVVGNTSNKATIFNYFINNIKGQQPFMLWKNACRNIIDLDDLVKITDYLVEHPVYHQRKINIANPVSYPVGYLVEEIESFFEIKAVAATEEKGFFFSIDISEISEIINSLNLQFDDLYIWRILNKYFTT